MQLQQTQVVLKDYLLGGDAAFLEQYKRLAGAADATLTAILG